VVDNAADSVTEGQNEGIDQVSTLLAGYTLSNSVENLKYTGNGATTGIGNALDNEISGGDKGNSWTAAPGDLLTGGLGADSWSAVSATIPSSARPARTPLTAATVATC
jgi:hypothetical protein